MPSFIRTKEGASINLQRVVNYSEDDDGMFTFVMSDGLTFSGHLSDKSVEALEGLHVDPKDKAKKAK